VAVGILAAAVFLCVRQLFCGPTGAAASITVAQALRVDRPQVATVKRAADHSVLDWLAQPRRLPSRNLFIEHPAAAQDPLSNADLLEQASRCLSAEHLAADLSIATTPAIRLREE